MLRIICLDDEASHNHILSKLIRRGISQLNMEAQIVLCTQKAKDVLNYAHRDKGKNVYMLDIELNQEINGMELTKRLHEIDPEGYIVYVSAHQHYAMLCLHTHAYDFLSKPLTMDAIQACLSEIQNDIKHRSDHILPIRLGSQTVILNQEDIIYVQIKGNNLNAVTRNGNYTWRGSISQLEKQLFSDWFIRIHRHTLCAVRYITDVDWGGGLITMKDGTELQLSRRRAQEIYPFVVEMTGCRS